MLQRFAAVALALALVAVSAGAALVGAFWGFGLKCDDSCSSAPGWREDPNAWQWNALGNAGITALLCSAIFIVSIAAGKRTLASLALGLWAVSAISFLSLLRDSGLTSHEERGWVGLLALSIICVAAVAMTPRRGRAPNDRSGPPDNPPPFGAESHTNAT